MTATPTPQGAPRVPADIGGLMLAAALERAGRTPKPAVVKPATGLAGAIEAHYAQQAEGPR